MISYRIFFKAFLVNTLLAISIQGNHGVSQTALPPYSLADHPFSSLPIFASQSNALTSSSVIVKGYHRRHSDSATRRDTREVIYAPRSASYLYYPSLDRFCSSLDVLVTNNAHRTTVVEPYHMRFELHRKARVFVLVSGVPESMMHRLDSVTVETPDGWSAPIGLRTDPEGRSTVLSPDVKKKHKYNPRLSVLALGFEVPVPDDLVLTLPAPSQIKVDGLSFPRYYILFAKDGEVGSPPVQFDAPLLPAPYTSLHSSNIINPADDPPIPNDYCPEWLHDAYSTPSRTGADPSLGEPKYWRTWHPIVDPVYWCYFDHEHGSYPGPSYRPQFEYTAFKTADSSTSHGRQNESNGGFKIVAFPVPGDAAGRMAITTVHMHVGKARRFTARHHTMIFAVQAADGTLEAELHMKMDFGAAMGQSLATGRSVPLGGDGGKQAAIYEETIYQKHIIAHRRFNVLQTGDNFPETFNHSYGVGRVTDNHGNLYTDTQMIHGIYELWRGPLNTCMGKGNMGRGFRFDFEMPATAVNIPGHTDDTNIVLLRGFSMKRTLFMSGFTFAPNYCKFGEGSNSPPAGVFYTNSYFEELSDTEGPWSVRQYIKEGFVPLVFPSKHYKLANIWSGQFLCECAYGEKAQTVNIDEAIDKKQN